MSERVPASARQPGRAARPAGVAKAAPGGRGTAKPARPAREAAGKPSPAQPGRSGGGSAKGAKAVAHLVQTAPHVVARMAGRAHRSRMLTVFDRFASSVTRSAGSPLTFGVALGLVVAWAASGPLFAFSEKWQLLINSGTTIVTFLMVFLIQQGANKDNVAVHLKLDELLAANGRASDRLIGIEDLDEQDLREVADYYVQLAERAKAGGGGRDGGH